MTAPEILFVTRKWAPAVGGMETWSARLSEELGRLAKVEVIALPGKANGHPPGPLALLGFPFTVLRRYLGRGKAPDVLHLGDMALWPLALLTILRPGRPKIALSAHGTDVSYASRPSWRGRIYRAYQRLGARLLRGAIVTANSPATEAATRALGWNRVTVIPLATDMAGTVPEGLPQKHLLFAGRLVELKGCAWFIRNVLPLLPQDLTLKVAGTLIDRSEQAALNDPRVTFLGLLDQTELAQAYQQALCVIVPNIVPANGSFEGFGLIAVEAAAAGGVVLAADCGGLPAAVREGETGLLVQSGAANAWHNAINDLAGWTLETRSAFIAGALAGIEAHYRWPRVAQQTLAAYDEALG